MINLSKGIIRRYDKPGTLAVVSFYPSRGETYSTGKTGVASYTKNVLRFMKRPVIVFCDIEDKAESYVENHVLVVRCFRRGSVSMWTDIYTALRAFPQVKTLLSQYDFAMYGDPAVSSLGLAFLGFLRLRGYRTSVTLHHVVDDVMHLKGHVGLGNGPADRFLGDIYNFLFRTFYRCLAVSAGQVIVLEESLKSKLEAIAPWVKATAIPHGVDTALKAISPARAKRKLGLPARDHVIMFFGYVNWFKGADIFARTFSRLSRLLGKRVHIIIAGGESPTLSKKHYYQKFYHDVRSTVSSSKHITLTGYVPQKDIPAYFSAADLVVFPYRHYMTASGVLSLVFSYRRPFIISRPLAEMFRSDDFERQLTQAGLKTGDITFDLYPQSIIDMTREVLVNGRKAKLADMASGLRVSRAYPKISRLYEDALFAPVLSRGASPALGYR